MYHPCCLSLILLRLTDEPLKSKSELIETPKYSPFLFLISAKSQLREVMDDLTQRSKVKLNYELPDEVVEDYTYEMGRLKFKVYRYKILFAFLGD